MSFYIKPTQIKVIQHNTESTVGKRKQRKGEGGREWGKGGRREGV